MAKRLNSILGVDIGSQRIKVAELKTQGREPVVTALGMIDTPEGAVDHTGVYNSDAVGAALKTCITQAGATVSHVIVSISGQASVLVRTLEVPRMNATELREHMQWEINRNIPFAESTVVSDYKALADEDPNSPNMDVVMAIAPQSAIDTTIACIKRSGRTPAAIDVEPLSLARVVQMSYGDVYPGQTLCLVEMGHKTTAINIYRDGKLLMPRQIPLGGEMITQRIAEAMQVTLDEAERIKQERLYVPTSAGSAGGYVDTFGAPPLGTPTMAGTADEFQPYNPFADDAAAPAPAPVAEPTAMPMESPFAPDVPAVPAEPFNPLLDEPFVPSAMSPAPATPDDPEGGRLFAAVAPVIEEFVSEIRRSVDYFRSRGGEINRIMLAGGATKIRGLDDFVTRSVGLECDAFDPLRRLNINSKRVAPGYAEDHRQEFAIAIGNALHIFFD